MDRRGAELASRAGQAGFVRVPPCAADASQSVLVVDDDTSAVRRFCSTSELGPEEARSAPGLAGLRCSGSAQPSLAAFADLRRRRADVSGDELLVVDLRKESHGFVNGAAVSWYAENNWGTAGLTEEEALALERLRLRTLATAPTVRIADIEAVKQRRPPTFTEWQPRTVQPEHDALGLAEDRYVRLPVVDHCAPEDAVVDRFVELVRARPANVHLHVHCRGGKGRTATFLCLIDLLHHAAAVPLAEILARQARFAGYDLRKAPDPATAKAPYIAARSVFLEQFHAYARTRPLDAGARWSEWAAGAAHEVTPSP